MQLDGAKVVTSKGNVTARGPATYHGVVDRGIRAGVHEGLEQFCEKHRDALHGSPVGLYTKHHQLETRHICHDNSPQKLTLEAARLTISSECSAKETYATPDHVLADLSGRLLHIGVKAPINKGDLRALERVRHLQRPENTEASH